MRQTFNPRNGATIIEIVLGSAGFVLHRTADFISYSPFTTIVVIISIFLGTFQRDATKVFVEEVLIGFGRGLVKAIEGNKAIVVVK